MSNNQTAPAQDSQGDACFWHHRLAHSANHNRLREHIRFDLGEREKQGVARFVEALRAVTGETVYDPKYIAGF